MFSVPLTIESKQNSEKYFDKIEVNFDDIEDDDTDDAVDDIVTEDEDELSKE